jgi:excinuclease ABC subunit C
MDAATVRERAGALPTEPGVYRFLEGDRTLYVGKAVDLRDRVRSYTDPRSERVAAMVRRADDLTVAVTDTETQALLLEANLIKRHRPRYNVRLTDDKSYPLVQFTDHEVPRLEVTRDPDPGAAVYGPYTDVGRVETVCKAIREVYGLRGCSDHKYSGRDRPCLDHEMGLCSAPCTGEVGVEAYREAVADARRFFEGETDALAEPLRERMETAAAEERFERAAHLRDRLAAVEEFHGGGADLVDDRSGRGSLDVLGVADRGERTVVARLHAEAGKLVDRDRYTLATPERRSGDADAVESAGHTADDDRAAALSAFLPQFYADRELPDAVVVPVDPGDADLREWLAGEGVDLRVPGAGREARLVELAMKNARRGPDRDGCGALGEALGRPVERVEGVDVSHAGGEATVGSDVVFVDGDPDRSGYRRRRLADGNDDPASVRELLAWRASRAVEGRDDRPDPDLMLVDGGRAQVRAARAAVEEAGWSVPVLGLAKGPDRDEDRVVTDGSDVEAVPDAGRDLLRRVRDEAHRFAVDYHRTVREDVSTALDDVRGVGPATRKRLLGRFGSVAGVREATDEELREVEGVGPRTVERLRDRL